MLKKCCYFVLWLIPYSIPLKKGVRVMKVTLIVFLVLATCYLCFFGGYVVGGKVTQEFIESCTMEANYE